MRILVVLFAALAVASAYGGAPRYRRSEEITVSKEDADLFHKVARFFSFPLFAAPIRTTAKPAPAPARPPAPAPAPAKPPAAPPAAPAPAPAKPPAPAPAPAPAKPTVAAPTLAPAAGDVPADINLVTALYQLPGMKDILPPMSALLTMDQNAPNPLKQTVGSLDPELVNFVKSLFAFVQSKPSVNIDDPVEIKNDGTSM